MVHRQTHSFPDRRPTPRNQGFALLITITLLAFLVLLLVSLASLTRFETQVASNNQQLSQARQNALMALNIALGQLQKTAGPDQRITGAADVAGNDDGVSLSNGNAPSATVGTTKYWAPSSSNGLTAVQAGTRQWTGIWGNRDPSAPTAGNANIYEKTPSPTLLNWLVSGNENATFIASTNAATYGQITASNGVAGSTAPAFTPALVVNGVTAGMSATAAVTINGEDAVLLVGPVSTGTTAHPTTNEAAIDRFVIAPLVKLTSNSVPGLSGSQTIGRYAYWVGDEGVKTRVNLTDTYADQTNASASAEARYRLLTPPRSGLEIVSDFSSSNYAARTQSTTPGNNIADHTLSQNQLGLLDSANITEAKVNPRFHDLTTRSVGVLADSYNGGLRKDLTAILDAAALGTWTGTNGQPAGVGRGIIPAAYSPVQAATTNSLPRWNLLKSFQDAIPAGGSSATMTPATADAMGITPVISQVRLLFAMQFMSPGTAEGQPTQTRVAFSPLFVLSNPYNVPITSSGPLRFTIDFNDAMDDTTSNTARIQAAFYHRQRATASQRYISFLEPRFPNASVGGEIYQTAGSVTIPAGGSKIFTMQTYEPVSDGVHTISEGSPSASTFNGVYFETTYTPTAATNPADLNKVWNLRLLSWDHSSLLKVSLKNQSNQILQQIDSLNTRLPYVSVGSGGINLTANGIIIPFSVLTYDLNLPGQRDYGVPDGKQNTTLRPFADFNLRASQARVTKRLTSSAPYAWRTAAVSEFTNATTLATSPGIPDSFLESTFSPYWGRATTAADSNDIESALLFDLPRRSTAAEIPLFSLAQLQHANLTADSVTLNPLHQPGYAVGNSYQNPFVRRGASFQDGQDVIPRRDVAGGNLLTTSRYFDISYLLNASFWDGYFFSTVPSAASGAAASPANSRHSLLEGTASSSRDTDRAASVLTLNGPFNVNSTSVDAWTALLGGMNNLPALSSADTSGAATATFARSIRQPGGWSDATTGDSEDAYTGFRKLTPLQVRKLANAIVLQVRQRGPFVSLAHFVNRTLVDATSDTKGFGLYGPLQAAIDEGTDINDLTFLNPNTTDVAKVPPVVTTINNADVPPFTGDTTQQLMGTFSIYHPDPVATTTDGDRHFADAGNTKLTDRRSIGIPGWLTQADVLQAIGPVLSARSDTFTIRAYGEILDPVNSTNTNPVVTGRAWCEAVVQRLPDYVNPADAAEISPASTTSTDNKTFGRKFKIVSFRWLSPEDI